MTTVYRAIRARAFSAIVGARGDRNTNERQRTLAVQKPRIALRVGHT